MTHVTDPEKHEFSLQLSENVFVQNKNVDIKENNFNGSYGNCFKF